MPTIYRSMKRAEDGLPIVGHRSKELGVRIPPDPNADIDADETENVVMNGQGMSVADHWQSLPRHLIPKRLRYLVRGAIGSNATACYRLGQGPFLSSPVSDRLALVVDSDHHGVVCPSSETSVSDFQAALMETRIQWKVDERPKK
jgi:hypothetical protein